MSEPTEREQMNKRWRNNKRQLQTHQKFAFKILALNRHEQKKNSLVYLMKWASLFITALIRVTQTDPEREKWKRKKKKLSDSWLTALINKKQLQILCISSHSLWSLSGGDWEMAENSPWLYKLFIYSLCSCIHVHWGFILMRILFVWKHSWKFSQEY